MQRVLASRLALGGCLAPRYARYSRNLSLLLAAKHGRLAGHEVSISAQACLPPAPPIGSIYSNLSLSALVEVVVGHETCKIRRIPTAREYYKGDLSIIHILYCSPAPTIPYCTPMAMLPAQRGIDETLERTVYAPITNVRMPRWYTRVYLIKLINVNRESGRGSLSGSSPAQAQPPSGEPRRLSADKWGAPLRR